MEPQPPSGQPSTSSTPPAWQPTSGYPGAPPSPEPRARPGTVTAAGVILIVLGVLVALLGVIVLLVGSLFGSLTDMPDLADQLGGLPASIGGFIAAIGGVLLVYGAIQAASGIFVLSGRSWARVAGLIFGTLGILFGLAGAVPGEEATSGGVVVSLIVLGAYVFVVWALATGGRYFAPR